MILALILSATTIVQPASADSSTLINFNGRVISSDVDPIIVNGRVLVPLRLISEELGYFVHWDSITQTVFVNNTQTDNPGTSPKSANGIRLIVNGQTVTGDVAPRIIHNRVMVPIRVISESLNSIVKWESEAKEVLIVQLDRLGQDASRSVETFLTWQDASYDYPPDGTPDDFSKWITGKMNAIEEGYCSVLNYRSILEQVLTASELENNDLYQLVKETFTLMEYEKENVIFSLIHPGAGEKLIEIAAKLSILSDEQETDKVDKNRNGPKSGQIDTALYYFCKNNYEKELYDNKILWRVNDITLIANKSNLEEKHTSDTIIDSMTIEKGNRRYDIKLDEKPISISSFGLSASNEYLAVNAFYHYGYKVIIINLNSGEYFILNEYLKSNGEGFVEMIHAYNWSPDGNKLAFAFGNTSQSRLAIYNLNNKTFSFIPAENDYITTAYILWHKNGKGLDFISEYPSNHNKLYRYYFDRDYVDKIMDVKRDDLLKLQEFNKTMDM